MINKHIKAFENALSKKHYGIYKSIRTPFQAQKYLDSLDYCHDYIYRCPVDVMEFGKTCCFEGALLAAALLRKEGYTPVIIEMTAPGDDDHIIFLYRKFGCWGAVAKSNYAGLRFREPVYRTLRELVLTYFEL